MKTYTEEQLRGIIKKHQKWLHGEEGGERAVLTDTNLMGATLRGADLAGADLTGATLAGATLAGATLRGTTLTGTTLTGTTLRGADLRGVDLRGVDLTGANIDYSCWPLWCGSLDVKVDKRIFAQLAYHLCRVIVDDEECKAAQEALYPIANQFHRVKECGRLPITRKDEA